MCDAHANLPELISRRTWLTRMAGGLFGLWAGIELSGKEGFGILVGGPKMAAAQAIPAELLQTIVQFPVQPGAPTPAPGTNDVRCYALVRGSEVTIVDTLTAGNITAIGSVLQANGLTFDNVVNIIITHMHGDHQGSLQAVSDAAPRAKIFAGARDVEQIRVSRPIQAVREGDEVFGLQIIDTPGHTPGHISVYEPVSKTLVAGDAIQNRGGNFGFISQPQTVGQLLDSLVRLRDLPIEKAYFGHGFAIEQNAGQAIVNWAAEQRFARLLASVGVGFSR